MVDDSVRRIAVRVGIRDEVPQNLATILLDDLKRSGFDADAYAQTIHHEHLAAAAVVLVSEMMETADVSRREAAREIDGCGESRQTSYQRITNSTAVLKTRTRIGRMHVASLCKRLHLSKDVRETAEELVEQITTSTDDMMVAAATAVYAAGRTAEGVTQRDVADTGGVSAAGVRKRFSRDKEAIRETLRGEPPTSA